MNKCTNEFVAASWYLRSRKSPGPRTSNTSLERAISAEVQRFKVLGNELKGGRAGMISALLRACITKTVALSAQPQPETASERSCRALVPLEKVFQAAMQSKKH